MVDHDYRDYKSEPTDLRLAYHLTLGLFHLRDWTFWEHKGKPSCPFNSIGDYQSFLEQQCSDFGYMRDLANAVKHAELDSTKGKPSTQIIGLANTEIRTAAFQSNAFQNNAFQTRTVIVSETAPNQWVEFEPAADAVMQLWNKVFASNNL